jgi:hypothetical protein
VRWARGREEGGDLLCWRTAGIDGAAINASSIGCMWRHSRPITGPQITGPKVTGSQITGPQITGPKATGPQITGPQITPGTASRYDTRLPLWRPRSPKYVSRPPRWTERGKKGARREGGYDKPVRPSWTHAAGAPACLPARPPPARPPARLPAGLPAARA